MTFPRLLGALFTDAARIETKSSKLLARARALAAKLEGKK
jgi:hypothetical protein